MAQAVTPFPRKIADAERAVRHVFVRDLRLDARIGHVNLVETLAERIAEACLADLRVDAARGRVEKLAAIPEAASVGIEIERIQAPR